MNKYDTLVFDLNSIFYRSRHVTKGSLEMKTSLALHVTFRIIERLISEFSSSNTKMIFALDGKSWRYEIYKNYKLDRRIAKAKKSHEERKEDRKFEEVFFDFVNFLEKFTNSIVLRHEFLEADDLISVLCRKFDVRKTLIITNDNDFVQLINENVNLYLAHKDVILTKNFAFTFDGKPVHVSITNKGKIKIDRNREPNILNEDWTDWALFLKICRGDASDGIFPICPGTRTNSLEKVFFDRKNKGFHWNNFMLSTWTNSRGDTFRVLDRYRENQLLINLRELPKEIEEEAKKCISNRLNKPKINNIGIHFLKFCGKYNLIEISRRENFWARVFSK